MKTYIVNAIKIMLLTTLVLFSSACKKIVEVDPPINQLSTQLVFDNDDAAISAITGIYGRMVGVSGGIMSGSSNSITCLAGMSADEYIVYSNITDFPDFGQNNLLPANSIIANSLWSLSYQYIYTANAVLEGLDKSDKVTPVTKKQLQGEAKFIRAFCYFYLTNLFGDIPLHLTTDYRTNTASPKTAQNLIYSQIEKDLKDAQAGLGKEFLSADRVRPNYWAATALLARTYLYMGNWSDAEILATTIIDNKPTFSLKDNLDQVFLKNSTEAIWQFYPNRPNLNTSEGALFVPATIPETVSISDDLRNAFEPGDKRRTSWVGTVASGNKTYYFPNKYKIRQSTTISEYSVVFRLAEQYLIRAEARINLNKIDLGIKDLNILRNRARPLATIDIPNPLPALSETMSKPDALLAVEKERRIELFSEWGHRWLDLKRTNRASTILSIYKGTSWQSTDVLYPIPQSEINANPAIIQNNGYQ